MDSATTDEWLPQANEGADQNVHNVSVAESVVSGLKLQQKKSKGQQKVRIVNIISEKEASQNCRLRSSLMRRGKSTSLLQNRRRNLDLLFSDVQPESRASNSKSSTPICRKSEKTQRCPLRLAELAEPSKRHCIGTWRESSNILPEFMVERLKRQVMNQKVVAQIPDAVDCFKIKPPKKKSPCKPQKCAHSLKKHTLSEAPIVTEARNLSTVFAHRIATRLMKSNVACPNSTDRFQILSKIIAKEINDQLFYRKRKHPDYCYDPKILQEMSVKIAMWMISILKDAEQKIIEEQLRARIIKENQLKNDDSLGALINTYFQASTKNNKDLEEEEGPALDAIDRLISNVFDLCMPIPTVPTDPVGDISHTLSKIEEMSITETKEDVDVTSNVANEDVTSNVANEDVTSNVANEDVTSNVANKDVTSNVANEDNISDGANVELKEAIEITDLPIEQDEIDTESKYDSISDDDVDILKGNVDDKEATINVSDVVVALEGSLDKRKKVKFTHVDDEPGAGELAGGEGGGERESKGGWESSGWGFAAAGARAGGSSPGFGGTSDLGGTGPGINNSVQIGKRKEEGIQSPRLKKALSEISFRPPNESLLSVVDENWPTDLSYADLKPSLIITKSFASLANIQEKEEDYDNQEIKSSTPSIETKDNFVSYTSIKEETAELKKSESSISSKIINDENKETNTESLSCDNIQIKIEDYIKSSKILVENFSQQPSEEIVACNSDTCNQNAGKGDHLTTTDHSDHKSDSDKNITPKPVKHKCEKPSKQTSPSKQKPREKKYKKPHEQICTSKLNYRVDPRNAPSWVQPSSSQDFIQYSSKCGKNMYKYDFRRWCADLDKTAENLKEWNRWLELTCKKVFIMKQQSEVDNIFSNEDRSEDLKEWVKLKKSLDRDAILWKKLTNRTLEVLKSYHDPNPPLIVSTENSVKCNCSRLIKKPKNSPESTTGTQPSCSTALYYQNRYQSEH